MLRLQELKKDLVKKGDLDAARAFDKAIKGEAKGDEEEPATLTKMRTARAKALEAAFKPIDKQYWEDLKLLKGYTQRQGDLEKMEVVIAEIDKVMAPYKQGSAEKLVNKDFPKNGFYRMTAHNGLRESKDGQEIICSFRVMPGDILSNKRRLFLRLSVSNKPNSHRHDGALILNGSGGKIIARLPKDTPGRGASRSVLLDLTPAEQIDIAIVVKGEQLLRLEKFYETEAPKLFLTLK